MPTLDDAVALGISERLQKIRKRRGFSQDDLVAKASVSRANLTALEQNRHANLRLTTLVRFAAQLEVDVLDFLSDRPEKEQRPESQEPLTRIIANVKAFRAARGLSQESLSVEASRFRTYVGRLENRKANPLVVDLQDLAKALGVAIPDLLQPAQPKETR
ncbi:transcriptional regulator [Burkholderia sp. SG-MS1]|uniref:helix-turn-helix domain-containing protein n=1 Tax=Paraburkholderia sp. SG-MS1 TaxID=2023741 RepID=UPI00144527A0|nr:helix-turn-helix domain-containing protein [Paraburkholderia sp. SG-MS1]NKJ47625.1 transcriptional regulator [Paraburkholderia sp. SG-MS1]